MFVNVYDNGVMSMLVAHANGKDNVSLDSNETYQIEGIEAILGNRSRHFVLNGGFNFINNNSFGFEAKYESEVDDEKTISLENIERLTIESVSTDINFILSDNNEVRAHLYGKISSGRENYFPELKGETKGVDGIIKVRWPSFGSVGYFNSDLKLDVYIPAGYSKSLKLLQGILRC